MLKNLEVKDYKIKFCKNNFEQLSIFIFTVI